MNPRSFCDAHARDWDLSLTIHTARRVRDATGVIIYDLLGDGMQPLGQLLSDPFALMDVCWAVCSEQAAAREISQEDFGRAIAGDALEDAAKAFMEALIDFFPNRGAREPLRRMVEKGQELSAIVLHRASEQLNRLNLEGEASELISKLKSGPASSASSPAA
jgi:hypothetical protein